MGVSKAREASTKAEIEIEANQRDSTDESLDTTVRYSHQNLSLRALRDAIPDHCFQASWITSLSYLSRDLILAGFLFASAWTYIPIVPYAPLRCIAWALYGFVQGLVFTGLWVIGHELGHGATLPSPVANDLFGFTIHSCLMTPYFAWQSTHRKHHRYTAHIDKDPNHIPLRYEGSAESSLDQSEDQPTTSNKFQEMLEDTPLYILSRLLFQQILGWPMYLATSIASGATSSDYRPNSLTTKMPDWLRKSHFNPFASLFQPRETLAILVSDLGLILVASLLREFSAAYGVGTLFLLYGQPLMWLNHWITMVTFLHHTHPDVPKFETESWTFVKGAAATIDRDFGAIGRFFFHNVIDYHVVHHLFPRIPFYHAPEATEAVRPVLGRAYHIDKTNYFEALWREFTTCQWVCPDKVKKAADQALWFVNAEMMDAASPSGSCRARRRKLATWWKL